MLDHVKAVLPASGAHGFDHTLRVVSLCETLGAREGADMAVLIPAAIFHDIARPVEEETGAPHEEAGARMAEAYLCSISYPADLVPGILAIGGDFNLVPLALEKHLEVGGLGATVFGD